MRTVLVTGVAGFIGFHTAEHLLARGDAVVGLDSLNTYYDVSLKEARLDRLRGREGFRFLRTDLVDREALEDAFTNNPISDVVHLAAQVGVRASLEAPRVYVDSNVVGFLNILECCRHHAVRHLVYASSSSVYGGSAKVPYRVRDGADHPINLYAATKRANELMAHSYSHLFGLPTTGLRFFTVYGPWGRPDMAMFRFARAILEGEPLDIYNGGDMERDFTFVVDVVDALLRVLDRVPSRDASWDAEAPSPGSSSAPYRLYNIGNALPVRLTEVIDALEAALGRRARRNLLPMHPGDMRATHADVTDLEREIGYRPATDLRVGIQAFVDWFVDYYGVPRDVPPGGRHAPHGGRRAP